MDHRPPGDRPPDQSSSYGHGHQHSEVDVEYERRRAAATRDYTTPAVVTLILYFVCWLPGLVANVIYYLNAQKDEALAGTEPQGKSCLLWLLIVMNLLFVLGILAYCMFFVVIAGL